MVKRKSGAARLKSQLAGSAKEPEDSTKEPNDTQAEPSGAEEDTEEADMQLPIHRVQKKIARRVNFYEKVAASSLRAKSSIRKKRRKKAVGAALGDLSTLSAALGTAAKEAASLKPQRGLGCGGAKARKRITTQETVRLQQVLRHPDFLRDPLAAVASHLSATLPPVEPPKPIRKNVTGSQRKKLKRQKARIESEMNM